MSKSRSRIPKDCRFYRDLGIDDGGEYCGMKRQSTLCQGDPKDCGKEIKDQLGREKCKLENPSSL